MGDGCVRQRYEGLEGQDRCYPKRLDQGAGIGNALPGEIKCCAVGNARANDRQAEGHINGSVHVEQLQSDVALIMVHRDYGVKLTGGSLAKKCVGWQRASNR